MAVISMTTELDVLNRYTKLMQTSVGSESIYIRTKETLDSMFRDYNLNAADKSTIMSQVLGSLSSSISASAMTTALQWATTEKDLYLKKLELGKQLDILDNQIKESAAAADKMYHESIAIQANTIRMLGTPTVVDGKVLDLANEGKVWQDIKIGEVQQNNLGKEGVLLDSRLDESFAAIHKTVADTVTNFGAWNYQLASGGITTAPNKVNLGSFLPLSDVQRTIAQEQAKGYSYNAWANAVTASAGMIGTVVASDGNPDSIPEVMDTFKGALSELRRVVRPTFPSDAY